MLLSLARNCAQSGLLYQVCNNAQRQLHCSGLTQFPSPSSDTSGRRAVTLIPGDGVGPELMSSVKAVFSAAGVPVDFEEIFASEVQYGITANVEKVVDSCKKNKVILKGIISSPLHSSEGILQTLNMRIRRSLDLFANVVHITSLQGFATRHKDLDFVIIRESTEGEYSALEHESVPGVVESLKIITRVNSNRIAKFAFDYAVKHGRKKVTAVHKANIMKLSDGLFLHCCEEVAKDYPSIEFGNMIIDNTCMQLVSNPWQFDVMVMPNLYGNIVDNLAAGLVGGAGVVPGESHGSDIVAFEPGARHAFAESAGRNMANPTAILLCASNMLSFLGLQRHAELVQNAVKATVSAGKVRTTDMEGYATRSDFTEAVIRNLAM